MIDSESFQLTKDNFDLDNMKIHSESTIEHDDSKYDHWELTMYLPKNLTREEIETLVKKILEGFEALEWIKKYETSISRLSTFVVENEQKLKNLEEFPSLKQMKERAEKKLGILKLNSSVCSEGSRTKEIIDSNIRVCESILNGDSST